MIGMKNKLVKFLTILCVFVNFTCAPQSTNDPGVPLDMLKKKVISHGNKYAYEKLYFAYFDESGKEDFILYSIIMANKYESINGYYDVYSGLITVHENGLADMNEDMRNIAIQYLKKAANLNSIRANEELGNLYIEGEYILRDTSLGKKLIKNASILRDKREHWYYRIFN